MGQIVKKTLMIVPMENVILGIVLMVSTVTHVTALVRVFVVVIVPKTSMNVMRSLICVIMVHARILFLLQSIGVYVMQVLPEKIAQMM